MDDDALQLTFVWKSLGIFGPLTKEITKKSFWKVQQLKFDDLSVHL